MELKTLYKLAVLLLPFILPISLAGQGCEKAYETGDCRMDLQRGYRVYSQSRGFQVDTRDTLELNVVFYGQKEYIFTFCTEKELYPIHFKIYDPESGSLVYDNQEDRFIESMGIGFDATRNLIFRIHARGGLGSSGTTVNTSGCLGVLFQYKSYD
jgi:hypothetical protein